MKAMKIMKIECHPIGMHSVSTRAAGIYWKLLVCRFEIRFEIRGLLDWKDRVQNFSFD